ncbi:DUF1499 domain-containing protein [Terrihabitans rhizophilus]|uniref:DUF1499 domain-containing protein n=1 Tax=Terrihabitans rhizophilus TaxID=3092662 RepID=A0ABU4RMH2_9HYPH|nr:DUF1499 domain-containing protein [Terrihabitans sp. PJ23]MDX6806024.1 DUF1499 domain-containing protein [Terrihabitans sp. PJ23]
MMSTEPYTPLASWSRRLGVFSLAVAVIALLVQRSGKLEPLASMAALASGGILAFLAILLAVMAFAWIWLHGSRGAGSAIAGALAGLLVLAGPAAFVAVNWSVPAIADITTDPSDPPRFGLAAGERGPRDNSVEYPAGNAAIQIQSYPDVAPLQVTNPPEEVYSVALDLVQKKHWRVLGAWATADGWRIEAVATTPVIRISQDVVIRIRSAPEGSRVDVRSASRWGNRDFETNASRVLGFLKDLAAALG